MEATPVDVKRAREAGRVWGLKGIVKEAVSTPSQAPKMIGTSSCEWDRHKKQC